MAAVYMKNISLPAILSCFILAALVEMSAKVLNDWDSIVFDISLAFKED